MAHLQGSFFWFPKNTIVTKFSCLCYRHISLCDLLVSHVVYLQYSIDHDTMSFPLSSCSSFSWSLLIRYFVANFYNVLEKHLWILEQIIMNDDVLLDKGRISTSCKQTNSCCTKTWFSWGYHARWEFAINSCWYCSNETSLHQWPFTSRDLIVNSPLQLVHISL